MRNINIALFFREKEIEMEELSWMGSRWLLVNWLGWWHKKKKFCQFFNLQFFLNFFF